MTAPVEASGSWPAWIARVAKPVAPEGRASSGELMAARLAVAGGLPDGLPDGVPDGVPHPHGPAGQQPEDVPPRACIARMEPGPIQSSSSRHGAAMRAGRHV